LIIAPLPVEAEPFSCAYGNALNHVRQIDRDIDLDDHLAVVRVVRIKLRQAQKRWRSRRSRTAFPRASDEEG